jgi:hypothetical protein
MSGSRPCAATRRTAFLVAQWREFVQAVRLARLGPIGMAALIAWLPVVRVDDLVKDRRPPKAAALRAVLDKIINANKTLSMRSRPLSGPQICLSRADRR